MSLAECHPFGSDEGAPTCAAASWTLDTRFRGYDKLGLADQNGSRLFLFSAARQELLAMAGGEFR
jgi:hypothetical protein